LTNPRETKYDLKYYVKLAKELRAMGAHVLAIKDMGGLCQPRAAAALVTALKEEVGLPIHFHTHDTSGIGAASVLAAIEAGVDAVDGAIDALSGLTSQPNLGSIVEALRFRISTWNCFGMAQGLSAVAALRAPFSERFRHADVISECASPDILCLQELLSRDAQQFFDGVGAGHFTSRFRDDNRMRFRGSVTMRGSGLGIGARLPLTKTVLRTFPGAPVGWDRLARKGALYTQLSFAGGVTVDLVTAHLQAGYDARAITPL